MNTTLSSETDIILSDSEESKNMTITDSSVVTLPQNDILKKIAFTLAEVLITLGIIGVVAAMTIPTLINNYQERRTVTTLKKEISVINQAFRLAKANDDDANVQLTDFAYVDNNGEDKVHTNYPIDYIAKYLKIAQDCGHEAKGCFDVEYKFLNGRKERDFENLPYYYKAILMDGTSIAFHGYGPESANIGEIWIDTNGKRKPNTVGKDIFLFQFRNTYSISPYGSSTYHGQVDTGGYNAANWVIQQGNMKYLKK